VYAAAVRSAAARAASGSVPAAVLASPPGRGERGRRVAGEDAAVRVALQLVLARDDQLATLEHWITTALDDVADDEHDRQLLRRYANWHHLRRLRRSAATHPVTATQAGADLLAWNDGYDRLARPLGILDAEQPNLLWFTLADERARTAYPDWDNVADDQVAYLRQLRRGDPEADGFATRLARTIGPAFDDRWQRRPLQVERTGAIAHPEVGLLRLALETLNP
jgi:hypothetical protein